MNSQSFEKAHLFPGTRLEAVIWLFYHISKKFLQIFMQNNNIIIIKVLQSVCIFV